MSISSLTQKIQLAKVSGAKTAQILGLLTRTEKIFAILLYGVCFASYLYIYISKLHMFIVHCIFAKMSSDTFSTQQFLFQKLNSTRFFPQVIYESREKLFVLRSNLYKEFVENRYIPRKVGIMSTISRNSHQASSQNCNMLPCTETRLYWRFFQKSSPISLSA